MSPFGHDQRLSGDEMLRQSVAQLCARLAQELAREPASVRWRTVARGLSDAAREISAAAGQNFSGSPASLLAIAQQIDLWVLRLGPAAAVDKAMQSAPLYLGATPLRGGLRGAEISAARRCA